MKAKFTYAPFVAAEQSDIATVVHLWNETLPGELPISSKLVRYNCDLQSDNHFPIVQMGQWAAVDHERVGLVIVSTLQAPLMPYTSSNTSPTTGWIDALIVPPTWQGRGIGSALLTWAEEWFAARGCQTIVVGGSLRPFMPGVPTALGTAGFFLHRGYRAQPPVWDLSANLATYQPPPIVQPIDGLVRPAQPSDIEPLDLFFQREFPGRWHWGFRTFAQSESCRISDYMVLWTERGIDGFCRLTFEDSQLPIERFYPYQLSRPWGQLGPIGVSAAQRRRGLGAALLDAGLRRLHNNGINGCVIDWTTLVDFYAHFGFAPYREYTQLTKVSEL
ncbi:MAG: GNAT family N-acetyltransferase [Caldilineaceae bacterium]|nr:GNAT family N-acetyltransferase [Caldilineaceae bacterium]